MVICDKCQTEKSVNETICCRYKGNVTYECVDEKTCNILSLILKEDEQKRQDDEKNEQEKYKHLPKEEQIKEMYGVKFNDLEEMSMKFRDGSVHYYYSDKDTFYSWDFFRKCWYKCTFDLKRYL